MMPTYATTSSRQSGYCRSTLSYQSDSIRLVQQIAMSSQYSHIGADATAGRTAIEQMRSKKLTLWYLGLRTLGPSILFGDNKNTNASSMPQAKLHKRQLMLSYTTTLGNHLQRESIYYLCAFVNVNGKHKTKTHQISWVNIGPTKWQWCMATTQSTTFLERRYSQCTGILRYIIWLFEW